MLPFWLLWCNYKYGLIEVENDGEYGWLQKFFGITNLLVFHNIHYPNHLIDIVYKVKILESVFPGTCFLCWIFRFDAYIILMKITRNNTEKSQNIDSTIRRLHDMKLLVDIIFSDVINFSNGGFKLYQGSLLCFSERPCYIDIRLDTSIIYESRKIELIRCFSRGGTIAGFFNYEVFPCSFADASLEPPKTDVLI